MGWARVGSVLLFVAVPVMAGEINYTFDIVSGSLAIDTTPNGIANPDPAIVALGGTFSALIDQSDCHIGEGDAITLGSSDFSNTETVTMVLATLATATIQPGGARFLGFAQPSPAVIPPGGAASVLTDVQLEATMFISGALTTTFTTTASAGTLLPFTVNVSTSVFRGQTLTVNIAGVFNYEIPVVEINQTLTLDMIVDITGTTIAVPDPAFGGLTAMGLAGAGAWIRRRRS